MGREIIYEIKTTQKCEFLLMKFMLILSKETDHKAALLGSTFFTAKTIS